jgi:hypothetical protein
MTWQEYQDAVGMFYEQSEGIGIVERNVFIPDKSTGQKRQIDTLLTIETKGHTVSIAIDAKFHSAPIDVKDVEGVAALADAVQACMSVIVCSNGWTGPAKIKADSLRCDLRLLTLEEALDLFVPDKWEMCPSCLNDCIVVDNASAVTMHDGSILWWIEGTCRECSHAIAWCQDCGTRCHIRAGESILCHCGYQWDNADGVINLSLNQGLH